MLKSCCEKPRKRSVKIGAFLLAGAFFWRILYRIDKLGTASTCTTVGTASIDSQIHLVTDICTTEI
jgi:hypothetical protein